MDLNELIEEAEDNDLDVDAAFLREVQAAMWFASHEIDYHSRDEVLCSSCWQMTAKGHKPNCDAQATIATLRRLAGERKE